MATVRRWPGGFGCALAVLVAGLPGGGAAQTGAFAPPALPTLADAERAAADWRAADRGELTLGDLQRGRSHSRRGGEPAINDLRAEALKETALRYGARAGLYARTREINRLLDRQARRLDPVFLFAP